MEEKEIKDININIDNTDSALGWVERILKLIKEYGPFKIIGATFMVIIVSMLLYFSFNITKAFELYDAWKERAHMDKMELRMEMAPKIQSLTDKLTYGIHASRTIVLELHNGNTGNGGLPFTKCSATYESMNLGVYPIAQQYQEVNLSLMPFANKLFNEGYWCGDCDELQDIDRGLYYKMKSNGCEHFAACVIEGIDNTAIAFMIVSFDQPSIDMSGHDCYYVRENIRHIAMELAVVLEVSRLTDRNNNKKRVI